MKTSFSISASRLFHALLLPFLLVACSDDTGNSDDACWQEEPPATPGHPSGTKFRGRVNVEHNVKYNGGSGTPEGSVTASFSDLTFAEMKSRQPGSVPDFSCAGLTGAPYKVCHQDPPCTIDPLDADAVEVEGLEGGKLNLDRTAIGRFSKLSLSGSVFAGGTVKVAIKGQAAKGFFPSYDQSLDAPALLDVKRPDLSSSTPVGESDLKLSWTPGNGDFMVVELKQLDQNKTDKVQCILKDDGCHNLHAGVLDWLEVFAGDQFKLTMARVKAVVKTVDSKTSVQLHLASQVEATLTR